jgi:drug/metabolite transporter (DMT)-like permease
VLLLLVTLVWGGTFPLVKNAVAVYSVMGFLAVRFGLAALAMLPLGLRRSTRGSWLVGGGIGLVLATAYVFQTVGIRYTTATNSGLITGLFIVFAPLWNRALFGVRTDGIYAGAIAASVVGLALLTGAGVTVPTAGDWLTLGCAAAFGIHIALLDRYARRHDPFALALAQLSIAAVVFALVWPFAEPLKMPPAMVWPALLVTALIASAGGFTIQTAAQRRLPAIRVAMVLTMEPVFAALFGRWVAGDRLTALQLVGGALMVAALLVANVHGARQAAPEPA